MPHTVVFNGVEEKFSGTAAVRGGGLSWPYLQGTILRLSVKTL